MKEKPKNNPQLKLNFGPNFEKVFEIDFDDKSLFGADDAAHVKINLLKSYSIENNECQKFLDEKNDFMVLCAPKGTGKTTLVRLWQNRLLNQKNLISIMRFDSQISPEIESESYSKWIRHWKREIIYSVYLSLTNNKSYGIKADMFKFIESVELRNEKRLNLIELIIEHLPKGKILNTKDIIEKKDSQIWFFLDEIDQYFTRTRQDILKMTSLLTACRELTSYISKLHIRTTIKPNVWAVLRSEESSMSNINELVVDYKWNPKLIKSVIARRVKSYIIRNYFAGDNNVQASYLENEDWLISQIFDSKVDFDLSEKSQKKRNYQRVPPHKTLAQLGNLKPRWVLTLCKNAASHKPKQEDKINTNHIKCALPQYGKERIKDISSEYKTQCEQISEIINAFYKANTNYKSLNFLLEKINSIVVKKMDVKISGVGDKCNSKKIARFLFEIGFIQPKNHISSKKYEFLNFEDIPTLIDGTDEDSPINTELIWEIHPSYRNALNLDRTPLDIRYKRKK